MLSCLSLLLLSLRYDNRILLFFSFLLWCLRFWFHFCIFFNFCCWFDNYLLFLFLVILMHFSVDTFYVLADFMSVTNILFFNYCTVFLRFYVATVDDCNYFDVLNFSINKFSCFPITTPLCFQNFLLFDKVFAIYDKYDFTYTYINYDNILHTIFSISLNFSKYYIKQFISIVSCLKLDCYYKTIFLSKKTILYSEKCLNLVNMPSTRQHKFITYILWGAIITNLLYFGQYTHDIFSKINWSDCVCSRNVNRKWL